MYDFGDGAQVYLRAVYAEPVVHLFFFLSSRPCSFVA